MGNISDRIGQIIKDRGISTRAFEQQIGCSNGVISKCINKGTDISSQWVTKIIETFVEINPRWLLTGEGSMLVDEGAAPTANGAQPVTNDAGAAQMVDRMLEMAKEIGRLQEQVRQLTIEQEKNAARANTASIANAG